MLQPIIYTEWIDCGGTIKCRFTSKRLTKDQHGRRTVMLEIYRCLSGWGLAYPKDNYYSDSVQTIDAAINFVAFGLPSRKINNEF